NKDIVVATVDPLGNHGILRFNHIQPPFNNVKLREAVLNLVDQKDYMGAAAGDPKYWRTCAALFGCGTPFETKAGADALLNGPNPAKAKQLIQEAGYKGEKIVLLSATDQPIVQGQALVTLDALRKAGLNVELQASDWGTLITRRASKEPIDKGGWSIFHTWTSAPDFFSPAVNIALRGNGEKGWFGWPTDPKTESLIDAWFKAPDFAAQKKLAADIQVEAYTNNVPYVPTGQFVVPTAYRKNLDGIIIAPVVFLWNVEKKLGRKGVFAYIVRRILATIPVMAVVALFVFALLHLSPGDQAVIIAGDTATLDDIARIRQKLGLDQPLYIQFVTWVWGLLHGDLGISIFTNLPVSKLIAQRVEPTVTLTISTLIVSVLAAIPMGVLAAWKAGSWVDRVVMVFAVLGFSVPVFVLAYLLIYVFAIWTDLLPVQGFVTINAGLGPFLSHLVMPTLALGMVFAALIARMTRASMLDVLAQDYIRTAQAKGLANDKVLI